MLSLSEIDDATRRHSDILKLRLADTCVPTFGRKRVEIVSELAIKGEVISLDDKHFKNCTLTDCELSYSGGVVILERTTIISCRHSFGGHARSTILYLQRIGLMADGSKWTDTVEHIN